MINCSNTKKALFDHLTERWRTLFAAKYEAFLYDLTSTCFESAPPEDSEDIRRFGYSRDKRSDCVQVVIALIVTPEGFPMAYDVLSGNTADKLAQSDARVAKERAMRQRRLRKYIKALKDIKVRKKPLKRDQLHQALGAARLTTMARAAETEQKANSHPS
jgi:hypothetical protein